MKLISYVIFSAILFLYSCQNPENNDQTELGQTGIDTTAATQIAEPEPIDSTYLISPGERIGKVEVGMPSQKLEALLGKPDSTDAAMGKALLYWLSKNQSGPQHYLVVYTEADFGSENPVPTVKQLQVTSPQFQTPDRISVGTPLSEIRSKYNDLKPMAYYQNEEQERVYIFDAQQQGIAFEVSLPDSISTAITVHEKGKAITETYLPVHPDMTIIQQP